MASNDENPGFRRFLHPVDRRTFLKCSVYWALLFGGGCALTVNRAYYEPKHVEPTYHQIKTDKLKEKITVVHLTDLHLDDDASRDYVPQMVNNCKPDLVLMTGDYLNSTEENPIPISRLENYVNKLSSKYGIYATFGNWDTGNEEKLFKNTDVKTLRDVSLELRIGENMINLIGMDYFLGDQSSEKRAHKLLKDLNKETFNIFLYHAPDLIEDIAPSGNIDLYLTGHTHGGQIRIPFLRLLREGPKGEFPYAGAIITMAKHGTKYESGRFDIRDTTLYVSRGIGLQAGDFVPKMRLFCKPEIAIFDIGPKESLPDIRYISPSNL